MLRQMKAKATSTCQLFMISQRAGLATQLGCGNKQTRTLYSDRTKGLCKQEVPSALWCYTNGGIFLLQEFKASRLGVS